MKDRARDGALGAELRRIRETAHIGSVAVAEDLGWSQPKISRIENGVNGVSERDLVTLLRYYGAPPDITAELLAMLSAATTMEGAWVVRAGGAPRRQREVAAVETRVRRIRHYQAMTLPGQLQSPRYAHAMAEVGQFGDPDVIVERRRARQRLLAGAHAPKYVAVLDARVLLYWPGDDAGLVDEQLSFLQERMDLPAVTVRLIPLVARATAVAMVPFVIYEHREGRSTVFVEAQTADVYMSADQDVAIYRRLFTHLERNSLDAVQSRQYLEVIRDEIDRLPANRR